MPSNTNLLLNVTDFVRTSNNLTIADNLTPSITNITNPVREKVYPENYEKAIEILAQKEILGDGETIFLPHSVRNKILELIENQQELIKILNEEIKRLKDANR